MKENTFIRLGSLEFENIENILEDIKMFFSEEEYDIENIKIGKIEEDECLQIFLWIDGGACRLVNQLSEFSKEKFLWVELSDLENIDEIDYPNKKHNINWNNYIMFDAGNLEEGSGFILEEFKKE